MREYSFVTLDVFTEQRFGGNPLAVVLDAEGLGDSEMQALAAEFNYSETTFVLPPEDPAHTARVRIFNRTYEMPFAGHPNVGTGYVLAKLGRDRDGVLLFEEQAGLVRVDVLREGGNVVGAVIAAPQPLSWGPELPVDGVAACVGLSPAAVRTEVHPPVEASVGVTFVIAEVQPGSLADAKPSSEAFAALLAEKPELNGRLSIFLYAMDGKESWRARMFSPLSGTVEDPATGSANATLAALRLSLGSESQARFTAVQGVEMRRPSALELTAARGPDGVRATVGGRCAPMFEGRVKL